MKDKLIKLALALKIIDIEKSIEICKLAGRYKKTEYPLPIYLQPAYEYIMYLKLMRDLDDGTFHYMKRKYLNTNQNIQKECEKELDKIIVEDAVKQKISSVDIRKVFKQKLKANKYLI